MHNEIGIHLPYSARKENKDRDEVFWIQYHCHNEDGSVPKQPNEEGKKRKSIFLVAHTLPDILICQLV